MGRDKSHELLVAENRWTSNRKDRRNAERAVENLNQNDQIIDLLTQQNALLSRQNEMLDFLCRSVDARRSG